MSPRSKRRRTGDRCHGTGCGQPDCGDCHRQDEDAAVDDTDHHQQQDPGPGTGSSSAAAPPPPPSSPPTQAPSPGLAAMIAALEEKALRDLLLQSAASSQEIQRSIKDAYHRQVSRPQPPPLLPQPLLASHLMMQQAAASAAAAANNNNTTRSASITGTTKPTRLPSVAAAAAPVPPPTTTTLSSHQHQHQHQHQMMRPVTNFDHYSKSAWHALNDTSLLSLSGSRQYTMAGDVYGDVCDCVNAIDEMTRDDSPLGTKQNAIETLREIAKSVILAADTVGYEVRKELQHDSHISDVMVRVAESMSPEERLRTGRRTDAKGGTLISKLEWVRDEAEGHCLKDSEGFARVLELLKSGFASSVGSSAAPIDLTTK